MDVKINRQEAQKVADAVRSRFAAGMVRALEVGMSFDNDGDECIEIVIHLDKDYKEEDLLKGASGLNGHVIGVLRSDDLKHLKHLYPYIRYAEGELNDES